MEDHLKTYLQKIEENRENGTEQTFRTPLENYLNSLKPDDSFSIHQEQKREKNESGTPDFKVFQSDKTLFKKIVGYIECKKLNYDLETLVKSEQIKKYSRSEKNILITNYEDFWLLEDRKVVEKASVKNETGLKNLFTNFLKYQYSKITTSSEVVKMLASQSFYLANSLKEYISEDENLDMGFYRKFKGLFNEFGESVKQIYSLDEFCDLYSQSLVYALFVALLDGAKFNETTKDPIIDIPEQYQLLREFLDTGYNRLNLPNSIEMILNSIMKNLNLIDIKYIEEMEEKSRDNLLIYLYEDFLKEYDKEAKKSSGVYYTPPAITDFIISAVERILIKDLKFKDGYIADEVKILDFATGTGTFLLSIVDKILEKNSKSSQIAKVRNKIVNDIFGFELLFTPYILAHTNILRKLKNRKIELDYNERLQIYLTNTLDLGQNSISNLLPYLQKETETANRIKNSKELLVIVGNPPYNSNSTNIDNIISNLLESYKPSGERNIKPLNDDYIKFIRFAQKKIDDAGFGVFGTITNNSFLDGITHRKMRESLLETFDEIYIVNLHGNSLKKEGDKNVFDIMIGVSIAIFVKKKRTPKKKIVKYFSTLENKKISRKEKFEFLESANLETVPFVEIEPKEPNFWFVEKDESLLEEYQEFWSVTEVFEIYANGFVTSKDSIAIQYSKKSLEKVKRDFEKLDERDLREKYNLQKESKDWQLLKAVKSFEKYNPQKVCYRPFDFRFTNYSKGFLGRDRFDLMQHFLKGENLGLVFERNKVVNSFKHIFISKELPNGDLICGKSYTAPLYLYLENMGEVEKTPNFTQEFKEFLETLSFSPTPEDILNYIYARLHSKKYREKYFEFLKTDFPRVPFTEDEKIFYKFASFGKELVELHTMENIPDDLEVEAFEIENNLVEKITFKKEKEELWINEKCYIRGVSDEVWKFEIGSYQVIKKWLDYRRKDREPISDFLHLENMIIAIKNTIQIMEKIDEV
jgi:predicted helicase